MTDNPAEFDSGKNDVSNLFIIDPFRIMAEEIVSSMDDHLLASQVLITGTDGRGNLPNSMKTLLTEIPVGGIMLFKYNLSTDNASIQKFLSEIEYTVKAESNISPFISVDHEGGTVYRFVPNVAYLPDASSYWDLFQQTGLLSALSKIEDDSLNSGHAVKSLGINMNLAPIAEYLNDDNFNFLLYRSYGPDPFFTAQAVFSFVRGMKDAGVLCVIKHFPGSSGFDPHLTPSVLTMDELDFYDYIMPFSFAIKNGARAVMAAHTAIPSIDSRIASMSPVLLNDWLRVKLGFEGIIISDDFNMAAAGNITSREAAINALSAGVDMMLIWQNELKRTHDAILSALEDGTLPRERLQDAVQRIIFEKLKMGLINYEEIACKLNLHETLISADLTLISAD